MHVAVNAAISADGKLSNRRREQISISGPADFQRVDRMRERADAIMVGVGTVVADDPRLCIGEADRADTEQTAGQTADPARVVADSTARTPPDASVLDEVAPTYLLVSDAAPEERITRLQATGADIVRAGDEQVALTPALSALEERGVSELMVEGGGELLFSLFDADLVDELTIYVGSILIGGREAPTLIDGGGWTEDFPSLELEDVRRLDEGVLLSYTMA